MMLVWKAMPSITPMMSEILRELWLISSIVATTCDTASPPATGGIVGRGGQLVRYASGFGGLTHGTCQMLHGAGGLLQVAGGLLGTARQVGLPVAISTEGHLHAVGRVTRFGNQRLQHESCIDFNDSSRWPVSSFVMRVNLLAQVQRSNAVTDFRPDGGWVRYVRATGSVRCARVPSKQANTSGAVRPVLLAD